MTKSVFVVATNGTGLYCREVTEYSTTVYADRYITEFDSYDEAAAFMDDNDQFYWDND